MGVNMFSKIDLNLLEMNGGLTTMELRSLEKGIGVTLDLVIKAKRLLEDYRKERGLVEDAATRTELNLLIEEINQIATKQFLIFTILERKGLISIPEMLATADSFDNEPEEGMADVGKAHRAERSGVDPKPKQVADPEKDHDKHSAAHARPRSRKRVLASSKKNGKANAN